MAEAAAPESDLWIVNISAGQTRTMTLDEVDDAYNSGLINEGTMVCEVGSDLWQPLYVVAGLDPPRNTAPGAPPPPPATAFDSQSVVSPAAASPPAVSPAVVNPAVVNPAVVNPGVTQTPGPQPPAGAPSPPRAPAKTQPVPQTTGATGSRLPSAKAPPLPADYMSHPSRSTSVRPNAATNGKASGSSTGGSSINKGSALTPATSALGAKPAAATPNATAGQRSSLKQTLPGAAVAPLGLPMAAATGQLPAAVPNPLKSTLQGPGPAGPPLPGGAASAFAAPAPGQLRSEPPPSVRSKAPPLPPNAFSHLAAEALAEVSAPSAPPLPGFTQPGLGAAPIAMNPSVPAYAPALAPAPGMGFVQAPAFASTAPAVGAAVNAAWAESATPRAAATQVRRSRAELWTIIVAAVFGLLITLHRNSILFNIASAVGVGSSYASFEKAVFGEPSIATPRGIQSLLQRTEKARQKSETTPDHP